MKVAVIDRDTGFVQVLVRRLGEAGFETQLRAAAVPAEELLAMRISMLVVDPEAAVEAFWEYMREVCAGMPALGVLVCSRRSTVAQRVRALRMGVDDWIAKPCHPDEAVARVEAITRRHERVSGGVVEGAVGAGEIEVRADQFQAFARGRSVELTRREFEVLDLLARSGGRVLEREELYQRVWGYAMARGDRSVDVYVRRVRRKLADRSPDWEYIHTHFGVGYRFEARHVEGGPESAPGAGERDDDGSEPETLASAPRTGAPE